MNTIRIKRYLSPAGELLIGSCGEQLCLCDWVIEKRRDRTIRHLCSHLQAVCEEGDSPVIERAIAELDAYFAGQRRCFDLPLLFTGSPFQCRVWEELLRIPYGTTLSYGELASRIGRPKAVRAVASANAANPISIFVPCHRVIGSNRKLTGYGGGLAAKERLLRLEEAPFRIG